VIRFLTKSLKSIEINTGLLGELSKGVTLSDEDRQILARIMEALAGTGQLPFAWTPQEDNFLDLNPRDQWLPYILYRYKFKVYPAQRKAAAFPVYINVEPTSICNLRCTMCFQSDATFTTKENMGMIELGFYRDLIDQAQAGGTKALTLASRGEPTLHKDIGAMLQYATGKFFDLKLNTNATRLTEKMSHEILSSGVNELVFSVDAADKVLYEQIRVGGNFDDVLANIRRFHEIRAKHYAGSKLRTRVSGVMSRKDQNPDRFKDFWSAICDQVVAVRATQRWDTYRNPPLRDLVEPCILLWERMHIWYDGQASPCDCDYKSALAIGNVKEAGIAGVWRSAAFQKLREAHLSDRRTTCFPCDRCGMSS
jgi:radical SAM protein with 4Fe4S-binding SPASM domain